VECELAYRRGGVDRLRQAGELDAAGGKAADLLAFRDVSSGRSCESLTYTAHRVLPRDSFAFIEANPHGTHVLSLSSQACGVGHALVVYDQFADRRERGHCLECMTGEKDVVPTPVSYALP